MTIDVNMKEIDVKADTVDDGTVSLIVETHEGDTYTIEVTEGNIKWIRKALKRASKFAFD